VPDLDKERPKANPLVRPIPIPVCTSIGSIETPILGQNIVATLLKTTVGKYF
jgi:hypothetical protein